MGKIMKKELTFFICIPNILTAKGHLSGTKSPPRRSMVFFLAQDKVQSLYSVIPDWYRAEGLTSFFENRVEK